MSVPGNAYLKVVSDKKRLGVAIKRIISDKVVRHDCSFIVQPQHMEQLQRAYDRVFPAPDLTETGKLVMASFRRNTRKRRTT